MPLPDQPRDPASAAPMGPDGLGTAPLSHGVVVWGSDHWRAEATTWLDARLTDVGHRRIGDVEQPHLRPWATALTAPTTAGRVWLKAASPGTAFEVRLYDVLTRAGVAEVLTPLAVDLERSWLLVPDGGPTLADRAEGSALVEALCEVLPHYARLQLTTGDFVDELLAAGVADMRPQVLPERFEEALAGAKAYAERTRDTQIDADFERLSSLREEYRRGCDALAASPVPATLQHDDLHARNIFLDEEGRSPRFFDWGDSVVAHPFASMLVTLRVLSYQTGSGAWSPAVTRVRDAYLEPFREFGPHDALVEQLELACHLGKVTRSLCWAKVVSWLPSEEAEEDAGAPFEWLTELLHPGYLGSVGDAD